MTSARFFDTSRKLLSQECAVADEMSATPNEQIGECEQGDPDCDPEWSPFSPILVDWRGNGWRFSGLSSPPVAFDIDADGGFEFLGWVARRNHDDMFLVLDRDQNGVIDDGSELFGNATPLLSGGVAANGFEALAEFDVPEHGGDADGAIDEDDAVWSQLMLWRDFDRDGVSRHDELFSLADRGVVRLGLEYWQSDAVDRHGNRLQFRSRAWIRFNGRSRQVETVDVFFVGVESN